MRRILIISESLEHLFKAIETTTDISFKNGILERILLDSGHDQVNAKSYVLNEESGNIKVMGMVDEYKPETLSVEFEGPGKRTLSLITALMDNYEFAFGMGASFRPDEESVAIFEKGIRRL